MFGRTDNDRNVVIRHTKGTPADPSVPPVLFMLFNRASTTRQVFEKVREARPGKIFVAANGPRPDVPSDVAKCAEVQAIFDGVDWECEVHTNFRIQNIDMHRHWWAAMDWFFEKVESGIILEDDCVPAPSFFSYCNELLEKYKNDQNIMHVNGSNFQFGRKRGDGSYYFSKYPHVWGWATWKRAWQTYDDDMTTFPHFKETNTIETITHNTKERRYWLSYFGILYSGSYKSCDVKWLYAVWANRGICLTPNNNLISNIGYGFEAAHTFLKERIMGQPIHDIGKMRHPTASPDGQIIDYAADRYTFKTYFYKNFFQKAIYKLAFYTAKLMPRR